MCQTHNEKLKKNLDDVQWKISKYSSGNDNKNRPQTPSNRPLPPWSFLVTELPLCIGSYVHNTLKSHANVFIKITHYYYHNLKTASKLGYGQGTILYAEGRESALKINQNHMHQRASQIKNLKKFSVAWITLLCSVNT